MSDLKELLVGEGQHYVMEGRPRHFDLLFLSSTFSTGAAMADYAVSSKRKRGDYE